jgi:hypothetical protein
MNRPDIEKLLGGYATGTLTPEEERALFAAALEDQELFDALAREQSLRDLLRDPAARASLLATLGEPHEPWYRAWMRWAHQPRVWAAAAAALMVLVLPVTIWQARHHQPQPVLTAGNAAPAMPEPRIVANAPQAAPEPARTVSARKPHRAVSKSQPVELSATADALQPVEVARAAQTPPAQTDVKPGATAETVPIAPPMPPAQPRSAGNALLPAPAAAPSPVTRAELQARIASQVRALAALSPIKWTVLRRQPDGDFAVANPADLQAGDTVKLRLESNRAGYVYVSEQQKILASSPIEAGKPFDTTLEPQGPGQREIEFWFSPRPTVWSTAAGAGTAGAVSGAAPPPAEPHPPSIRITLQYK